MWRTRRNPLLSSSTMSLPMRKTCVRTHADGAYFGETPPGTGSYHIQTLERGSSLYHVITHAAIPCEELDTIIVNRLMEHVHEISRNHEDIAEYEQNAHKIREERLSKIRQIESSIQDIASKQAGLTISLGQVTKEIDEETDAEKKEIKERRKQLIIEQIDRLELVLVTEI